MTVDLVLTTTSFLAEAAANGAQPPAWGNLIFPIGLIGIFYFMLIRPQMKAKKEQEQLISSVKTGDKAITNGGIVGIIANVKEKTVLLKVADNVKIEVLKTHLATVTKAEAETASK